MPNSNILDREVKKITRDCYNCEKKTVFMLKEYDSYWRCACGWAERIGFERFGGR